jgi:putative ABC transport system permease protein
VTALDLAVFAVGALRGHRVRTVLSVAGVAVGIGAVITLTALGEGARRYVVQEFMSLGANLLIVIPGKSETAGGMPMPSGGVAHDLTLADVRALETRIPLIVRAAPLATGTESVHHGSRSRSVPVLGSTSALLEVYNLEVMAGSFLPSGALERGGNEAVIGVTVAEELFAAENPLGQVIRIGQWRFRVVGVLEPQGRSLLFNFDDVVVVPVATAMRMFNRTSLFRILTQVPSADDLVAGRSAILELLAARHRVEDVTVITQGAVVSTLSSITQVLTAVLVAIASVSLTVAGVGIMNVMLVAVAERRNEIGLLKALGASSWQVLWVFLAEAVVLSTIGGVAGLGLGWLALWGLIQVYPTFPAAPPAWAVAAALAVSMGVGVLFGVLPARRATRLDPVAALARR